MGRAASAVSGASASAHIAQHSARGSARDDAPRVNLMACVHAMRPPGTSSGLIVGRSELKQAPLGSTRHWQLLPLVVAS